MANFAVLDALQIKDNWDAKRMARAQNIQYLQAANRLQEQDIADATKAQAAQQDYLNQLNNITILQPDMERIRAVESELRPNIAEKIKKYNGDVAKYMKYEGMTDLNRYVKDLLGNPTTLKAINNAKAAAAYQADATAGLVERYDIDPNTGQPLNSFAQQLQAFENGDADSLSYRGGFKPAKFDEKIFSGIYGSENRYKPKKVGLGDYFDTAYRALQEGGLNPNDAYQQANLLTQNYNNHLQKGGTALMYKWDAPPKPRKDGKGIGSDTNRGLYDLLAGAYTGNRPDLIDTEGYWESPTPTQRFNPSTGKTTLEKRQYLPEVTQLNGRQLGTRTVVEGNDKTGFKDVNKPNIIKHTFIVNRQDKEGKSLGKQFAVITDASWQDYIDAKKSNPFVFYPTPRALFDAVSIGSRSESGDATKTDKQLGTLESEVDNDPLGIF